MWSNERQKIKLGAPDPNCPTCGGHKYEFLDAEVTEFSAVLCGRDAVQIAPPVPVEMDLEQLARRLTQVGDIKVNDYLLRFVSDQNEVTVFRDGRAIIKGTDDISAARSIYARLIGT